MRAHVVIPEDLVREVDELVGPRRRSQFFVDAVREKVARVRLLDAAQKAAGSLAAAQIPGWESSDAAVSWVRASRQADERRLHPAARDDALPGRHYGAD